MTLELGQIFALMSWHNSNELTWPHDLIAYYSARHAVALLGKDLVAAQMRIRALEDAIKQHKQAHAGPEYMACFDVNADLWGMVGNE